MLTLEWGMLANRSLPAARNVGRGRCGRCRFAVSRNPEARHAAQSRGVCEVLLFLREEKGEGIVALISMEPLDIEGRTAIGLEVKLPKTTLLIVTTDKGYIMCGALDVALLNERLKERKVIAGRAVGVRTIGQLLEAPLESVTAEAEALGIYPGMSGREAILKMM